MTISARTAAAIRRACAPTQSAGDEIVAALNALSASSQGHKARFATTGAITVATNGLTAVDGVTPVAGDIALVKNQVTPGENGLYVVGATAWTLLVDGGAHSILKESLFVDVAEGTANAATAWVLSADLTTWTELEAGSSTPNAIAQTGAAGTSNLFARADHKHADPSRAVAGTALTDTSTQTLATPGTGWRQLPTLSQGGALTLGTTGAVAGDQIDVVRTSTSAFTYAIINGGAGAGTLCTFPVSKQASATFQFDGTNWALRRVGTN